MLLLQATRYLVLKNYIPQRLCAATLHTNQSPTFKPQSHNISIKPIHILPKCTQPYIRLVRLDRPTGFWLIYLPSAWGIAAAALPGHLPSVSMLSLFALGTLVMRGAACTVNDLWDRDIDARVARTADRPLASGEITIPSALVFLFGQLSLGLAILMQLNISSIVLGVSCMGLVLTYPVAKRTMKWPQLLLGFSVNWGVLLGFTACLNGLVLNIVLPVYAAAIFWTLFYDTIYAHLDREDDLRLGVNSTAINFGPDTSKWIFFFGSGMISSLLLAGLASEQSGVYYTLVGTVGAHLGRQVWTLDVNDKENCFKKFASSFDVGVLVFLAIALGNLFKIVGKKGDLVEPDRIEEGISRFDGIV